ncbi:GAF and ANTAR domain-containing protein [Actinopolymorpha pittospori]|uniref:ANTAR domain-containing protein n=1 Tax=Actinopolymorpha pittospori TaxID=648752 RepID=A0A927MSP6_9ACTN|nr:GAF and ANTAR domain-containing protein [Actinopolymorpha pittospori]MBE1606186.1 hypothetical protein [Actinopolymorpha pittospori]
MTEAYVELADCGPGQFDIAGFLRRLAHRSVELLDAAGASVMLADNHGQLKLVASSSPGIRVADAPDPRAGSGPGPEAYLSGRPVTCTDLGEVPERWEGFATLARAAGYRSAHAWPLRHQDQVLGAIELYGADTGEYDENAVHIANGLARIATITLLRERRQQRADTLAQQLQQALDSRLVIEQAKGMLAERRSLGIDQAFVLLRGHARRHQMRLATLASQVLDGTADGSLIARPHQRPAGAAQSRQPAGAEPVRPGSGAARSSGAPVRSSTSGAPRSSTGAKPAYRSPAAGRPSRP